MTSKETTLRTSTLDTDLGIAHFAAALDVKGCNAVDIVIHFFNSRHPLLIKRPFLPITA